MKRAFVFPGQGSQKIGMGKDLFDAFPAAKAVFEEVDAALEQNLSALIFGGQEADLIQTENAQPAIMAVGIAALRALEAETGKKIADLAYCVAGHSLGEYTALCAAGALSISDTAKLLRVRGQYMAEAAAQNPGAMAAILGLDISALRDVIQKTNLAGEVCVVANDNCPGQVVISGHNVAVDAVSEACKAAGAKRVVKLAVSGAFHSPLMVSAAEKMKAVLSDVNLKTPIVPLVSNVTADFAADPALIKDLLVRQVTGSVLWTDSIKFMQNQGVNAFVECGNGNVLAGLIKKIIPDAKIQTVGTVETVKGFS